MTAGIVSARGRDIGAGPYDDFIQIDAPVNKGNSGGPTFDVDGNVIGVNTAIFSPSGGSVGIAFAIPADTVKSVVSQLKDHGSVTRGWIGVQIQPVTQDIADSLGLKKAEGALVAEPQAEQPGGQGRHRGRRRHHRGQRQAGQGCPRSRQEDRRHGAEDLGQARRPAQGHGEDRHPDARRIAEHQGGARRAPTTATDGTADLAKLGLTLAPAARVAGAGSEGVVVTGVDPAGVAADHGFTTGDVILDVAGKSVSTPADVRKALASARTDGKRTVLMRVKSGDNTRFVALPVGRG